MTKASGLYPGFISLEESLELSEGQVRQMQLDHMNEYRTKLGLEGGLTFDIKRAEGCYIWDADGNKRLDFIGCVGVYLLGHNNPFVVENVRKYLATKPLTMDPLALKPVTAAFAHNMALVTPELTRTIINGGGGAEAVEAALKLVRIAAGRKHPERKRIVSTLNSFHGKTLGAVSAGGKDVWRRWQPVISDHTYIPYGDLDAVEEEFRKGDVIAFIAETIQGEGGVVVPPEDYFPGVRKLCDEYGVYMIMDEVQAGSCRTGYVWAHQYYEGLVPDIFTFAKGISDGVLPVSGIQVKDSVYREAYGSYDSAMMHTATYQDNNISAAVALSSLQYMIEHDVAGHVRRMGKLFFEKLERVRERFPDILAEVRGRGFMIGLKFGRDGEGAGYANRVAAIMAQKHFVHTMTSTNDDTILRCYPNIATTEEDFDWFLDALTSSIREVVGAEEVLAS
ncbi:aspartate aminotransferase family protein [Bifidobacterium cuniculi]|uniref:Putrescine aminotransferase n=1 Tax=Bifidobacterium cuniculi TaxID=1688 RepID=A0A087AZJ9_9BIFI|nr:aminotransferase class III-fold pyridoxal phosphate-dependent enzyme [Bifidobacterium cuniculi]KFI64199.1 Putrescine aminotransferase [Bifidobacterium cuniculi]